MYPKYWTFLFFILFSTFATCLSTPLKPNHRAAMACQSYNNIIRELRENWQSPIAYLKKRGYIPNDSEAFASSADVVKPKDATCNAAIVEDVQNAYTCKKDQKLHDDLLKGISIDMSDSPNIATLLKPNSLVKDTKPASATVNNLKTENMANTHHEATKIDVSYKNEIPLIIKDNMGKGAKDNLIEPLKTSNFHKNEPEAPKVSVSLKGDLFKDLDLSDMPTVEEHHQKSQQSEIHSDNSKLTVSFKNEIPNIFKDTVFYKNKKDVLPLSPGLQKTNVDAPKINVSFKNEGFLSSIKNKLIGLITGKKPEQESKAEFDFEFDNNFLDSNKNFKSFNLKDFEKELNEAKEKKSIKKDSSFIFNKKI